MVAPLWYPNFLIIFAGGLVPSVHTYPQLLNNIPIKPLSSCPEECTNEQLRSLGRCSIDSINCLCYGKCHPDSQMPSHHSRQRRNARNVGNWPKHSDGFIYVPYKFEHQRIEARLKDLVKKAGDEFAKHTCFRLVERTNEEDFVMIMEIDGCSSNVGMQGGPQPLSLAPLCMNLETVLHEFMHAMGFYHEMNRRDRDKHIKVNLNNIQDNFLSQYNKNAYGEAFAYGKDYDMASIMHYGNTAAAKTSGLITMSSIKNPDAPLGPVYGGGLSTGDKIMLMRKGLCDRSAKVYSGPYANPSSEL